MYCPNCGKDNPEGSKFCCACGTNFLDLLKKEEPVMPEQPVVQQPVIPEQPVVEAQPVVNVIETPVQPVVNNTIAQQPVVNNTIEDKPVVTNNKSSNNPNKNSNVGCFIVLALVIIAAIIFFVVKGKNTSSKDITKADEMITIVKDDNGNTKYVEGKFTDVKVKGKSDAYKALEALKSELKFNNAKKEFTIESVNPSEDITYYRFHQKYNNIEVYGTNLIIAVDKDGNVLSMNGYYIPNINVSTKGGISQEEAETIAKNDLGNNAVVFDVKKSIYADNNNSSLVYVIIVASDEEAYEYMIDANSGEIYSKSDVFNYTAYNYNSKVGIVTINNLIDTTYEIYDPDRKIYIVDGSSYAADPSILLTLFNNIDSDPITGKIYNGEFVYTEAKRPDIVDNAFEALKDFENIYDYYKNVLGRDSYDNQGSNIIVNIGLKESTFKFGNNKFQNAMWFPYAKQMYIGYDGEVSYTKSMDVLAHEFTHAVIEYTAGFALKPKKEDMNKPFETGALNEGIADIMGSLIEGKNWEMGDNINTIRNISDPYVNEYPKQKGGLYYFPDYYKNKKERSLEEYLEANDLDSVYDYDGGGVHHNSTVVSYAAYLMYVNGAFTSMEEEAKVWYNALFLMNSYSNFEDCALAVIQTAKNLGLSQESINIIYDAFVETNMLEINKFDVTFNVVSAKSKLSDVNIELKGDTNYSFKTGQNGSVKDTVNRGIYDLTVTKDGYSVYSKKVVINGETTFNIDLDKLIVEDNNNNNGNNNNNNSNNTYEIDTEQLSAGNDFLMYVEDVWVEDDCKSIYNHDCGIYVTMVSGKVNSGTVKIGDMVSLITGNNQSVTYVVKNLSQFRKEVESASEGDYISLVFEGNIENEIKGVQAASKPNIIKARNGFEAELYAYTTDEGGMIEPMNTTEKMIFLIDRSYDFQSEGKIAILSGDSILSPGDKVKVSVQLDDGIVLGVGSKIYIHSISKYGNGIGPTIGECVVTNVYK